MATSKPVNLQVSDVVQWFRKKELVINETFQRHSVWTPSAKTALIDTILNELPIPKIYIRVKIDPKTQTAVREVIDGQQRIRAIVEFASNDWRLTNKSEDFAGKKYEDLSDKQQEKLLGYNLSVDQLLNASDDDVIDIFARLNSYTVRLNAAELRHARFQTEFKFAVRKAAVDLRWFLEKYSVFSTRQRFRMADDAFVAEVFGLFLEGVCDGGEKNIEKLYKRQDDDTFKEGAHDLIRSRLESVFSFLNEKLGDALRGSLFSKHYHLLMLIAAYAHLKFGIPAGQIKVMPPRQPLADTERIVNRLADLESALEEGRGNNKDDREFVDASEASTHRIASRNIRFRRMVKVLSE